MSQIENARTQYLWARIKQNWVVLHHHQMFAEINFFDLFSLATINNLQDLKFKLWAINEHLRGNSYFKPNQENGQKFIW